MKNVRIERRIRTAQFRPAFRFDFCASGAVPPLGAAAGSLAAGPLLQKFGRRRSLMLSAPLFVASWIIISVASSTAVLVAARVLSGFCAGLVTPSAQLYVSSDKTLRKNASLSQENGLLAGKRMFSRENPRYSRVAAGAVHGRRGAHFVPAGRVATLAPARPRISGLPCPALRRPLALT